MYLVFINKKSREMYNTIRDAFGLDDETMVYVVIAMASALFQLLVLTFYFKKPVEWMLLFYIIVIFIYNITYYRIFNISFSGPTDFIKK
jgi:hypothetical protein